MIDAASRSAIVVDRLAKSYGPIVAVDSVSFAIAEGSTTGLLGGNGAGKTTTLSMLLGLLIPTGGQISIFGEDMLRHRYRVLPWMNFSSPYVDLPKRLSVREMLTVYGHLYGVKGIRERIASLARDLDLEPILKRPIGALSSGQVTRAALAKSLVNEPRLLLLDEPTASLDPDTADWVRSFLESYRHRTGATFLIASHNMAEVERLCDSVLIMRAGRIVDNGPPADLVARYGRRNLEEVFLDIARDREGIERRTGRAAQ